MSVNNLAKKLKFKENQTLLLMNTPDNYLENVGELPKGLTVSYQAKGTYDLVHLFVKNKAEFAKYETKALSAVKPNGILWIAYPKKTSKIQTDLTRDTGWDIFVKHDLQWLSLISFDDTWSSFAIRNAPASTAKKRLNPGNESVVSQYIDSEKRVVKIPQELQTAFKSHKNAADFFSKLSFTNRKEYVVWLVTAKQQKTKDQRLQQIIEKLNKGLKNPLQTAV